MAKHCPTPQEFILLLREELEAVADLSRAAQMSACMIGHMAFFGLKQVDRILLFKAINWALRELSKTQSNLVETFVHSNKLPTLSEREAMRVILKTQS